MRKTLFLLLLLSIYCFALAQDTNLSKIPIGAINGLFSVGENEQVYFSQGNLQYIGTVRNPYWKFAEHQWDYLGITSGQDSDEQQVDRDLFAWGGIIDQEGLSDWGCNPIRNGGNRANIWRTLTYEEWDYVFNLRKTTSGIRFAKARVNDVNGVILLPDEWKKSVYRLRNTNRPRISYNSNVITETQWKVLEQNGAVFLPAAGSRHEKKIVNVNSHGDYWSLSSRDSDQVWYIYFHDNSLYTHQRYMKWSVGHSVRLVHGIQEDNYIVDSQSDPVGGGTVSKKKTYNEGALCSISATPNEGYSFVNWTEDGAVVSSNETYSFTVTCDRNLVANFKSSETIITEGCLNGIFSVHPDYQVQFAQGNLQYIGSAKTPCWKFAEHQWGCLSYQEQNTGSSDVNRDLFGWGTSGYHDSTDPYNTNYQPWSTAVPLVNEVDNYFGYGPSISMLSPDLTGPSANYDWGMNNCIINGGNREEHWRTLTQEEWKYLLNGRITTSCIRFAKAIVNNVNGLILLPDDWDPNNYLLNGTNQSEESYFSNVISLSQWNILEKHGAVFLPAAGYRYGTSVRDAGSYGSYWSASFQNAGDAWFLNFYSRDLKVDISERHYGQSVRLVRTVKQKTE